MDRESLEKIRNLTKDKITVSNFQKDQDMSNKNKRISMKKISAVACICLVLSSGIVFAKDIEKFIRERFNFGLGDGIDSAAENGYIAEPEMDNIVTETEAVVLENEIETVELDINTGVKINNFLMDDYNLSAEIELNFDEEIKKHVDFDNIKNIEFSDLIVLDEEKRIIFAAPFMTNDRFDELCNKYELSYKRGEFNENYMNNGLNSFGKYINRESNTIQWIYNMYAEGYPKSKELNFYFTEITIYNEGYYPLEAEGKKCVLKGEWEIHLDVPEKMYNRSEEYYKVVSCDNDKFDVYTSKVMDTGFELGILISDIEKPVYPELIREKERELMKKHEGETNRNGYARDWSLFLAEMPQRELWNEYQIKSHPINVTGYNGMIIDEERANQLLSNPDNYDTGFKMPENSEGSYILNSNGVKFKCTLSPSRKANYNFVGTNKFDFYETFGMTKYDATDKITVVIEYFGELVKIELEKIK